MEFVFFSVATLVPASQISAGGLTERTLISAIGIPILLLNLFSAAKLYRVEVIGNFKQFCRRFAGVLLFILILAMSANDFGGQGQARELGFQLFTCWFLPSLICLVAFRFVTSELFAFCVRRGHISYNVVILGTPELARRFSERVEAQSLGVRVTGVFGYGRMPSGSDDCLLDVHAHPEKAGSVAALLRHARHHRIDSVVLALPMLDEQEITTLVSQMKSQPLRVRLMPCPWMPASQPLVIAPAGEVPGVNLLPIVELPIDGFGWFLKHIFDVAVASVALLFFGPVMLICAAGIKLSSPGPVLFRQTRIGYKNAEFSVYKFRTMHTESCNTGNLTMRNDPRVFEFGRLLRKSSLDELPQLLNVLKGDMSIVGPRPHMPEARAAGIYYHNAVPTYAERHRVKPGITGLAQVSGWRGPTETIEQIEQRVAHDLAYIASWSIWLDVKIMVKTAFVGFFGKNAF
jgi:Undecaprenyl-phosphate glucose phosphotransferase